MHKSMQQNINIQITRRTKIYSDTYIPKEIKDFTGEDVQCQKYEDDLLICKVIYEFREALNPDDELCVSVSSSLGILFYVLNKVESLRRKEFIKEPLSKRIMLKYLHEYGYKPFTNRRAKSNISSLEWHLYHVLGLIIPVIWLGLNEDMWKNIFKEYGIEETIDFISFNGNSVILIECIEKYSTSQGNVGERAIRKLLHLKEMFEKHGYDATPILVCGQEYEKNKRFFDAEIQRFKDIHFMFSEDITELTNNVDKITSHHDLLRYTKKIYNL